MEVTLEVWRRRTELSLHALHAEDVSQQQNQEYAWPHQQLTGLVEETKQYRELFEESRIAQSAAGPEIDRLRRREEELLRQVQRNNDDRAKFDAP